MRYWLGCCAVLYSSCLLSTECPPLKSGREITNAGTIHLTNGFGSVTDNILEEAVNIWNSSCTGINKPRLSLTAGDIVITVEQWNYPDEQNPDVEKQRLGFFDEDPHDPAPDQGPLESGGVITLWTVSNMAGRSLTRQERLNVLVHELAHVFGLGDAPRNSCASVARQSWYDPQEGFTHDGITQRDCDKIKDMWVVPPPDSDGGGGGGSDHPDNPSGDQCADVTCPPDHECVNGACVPLNGCVIPCPQGFECMWGACVAVVVGDPDCDWPFDCDGTPTLKTRAFARTIELGQDVILAVDIDGDGMISGRHEVFRGYEDARGPLGVWDALSRFDEKAYGGNSNGVIDPHDLIWDHLYIYLAGDELVLWLRPEELGLEGVLLP